LPQPQTYYSNSFTPFIVFFALFLVVVRSQKLPHFLRFNALQSMLLDISIMLSGLIIQVQAHTCPVVETAGSVPPTSLNLAVLSSSADVPPCLKAPSLRHTQRGQLLLHSHLRRSLYLSLVEHMSSAL